MIQKPQQILLHLEFSSYYLPYLITLWLVRRPVFLLTTTTAIRALTVLALGATQLATVCTWLLGPFTCHTASICYQKKIFSFHAYFNHKTISIETQKSKILLFWRQIIEMDRILHEQKKATKSIRATKLYHIQIIFEENIPKIQRMIKIQEMFKYFDL